MYSYDSRVRFSETDSEGRLTVISLLNYFQDCSTFHSEDLGLGVEYLRKHHLVWVLSAWQIDVIRYPKLGERVTIGTFPYAFKGFLGYRNFVMQGEDGSLLASANSIWSLLSTDTFKPNIPPDEMLSGYVLEEKLPMEYTPRKVAMPEEMEDKEPVVIRKHHLDTNHHVNNGQYVTIAMEYLPDGFVVDRLRVEYKMQAVLNDTLYPKVLLEEKKGTVALTDKAGKPFVIVEFLGEEKI